MKFKIILFSILFFSIAPHAKAIDFPDPPLELPYQIGDDTFTQAIEWQAYTGVFWIAYRTDKAYYPTSKGMTLEHWYGDSNHYLHPMRAISWYYSWNGTSWDKNPGYSYWNVRLAHGADWQTRVRANYDIYYFQESSPYYFDWTDRYDGIGTAYADYPDYLNPTLLMEANWDYGLPPVFEITSPAQNDVAMNDGWLTVSGTCLTDGVNRIGFANNCLGFDDIEYTVDCINGEFSGQFYKSGLSNFIIARDIESVSGDCVDYDDLMDYIEVDGFDVIEGYPNNWYFNFDYYDDYDIKIHSPSFDTVLTLPTGTTSSDFTFGFNYPTEKLENLSFNIAQYDSSGNILNSNYYNEYLINMVDVWNHGVSLTASTTQTLYYVVQLIESGEMKRQYSFGINVSDIEFIYNPDDYKYFFPRLVAELKKKIVFNYYFAFHDGFYEMFNGVYSQAPDDALDITFKSVSADGEYDMDIPIFSASDPRVKSFAEGLRPYIVAILWLTFASYVVFRVNHLFSDNK